VVGSLSRRPAAGVITRGDVYDADLGPHGNRPCVIVTRDVAIPVLNALSAVAVTSTIRGHLVEVELDERHGLDHACVANCDVVVNVPKALLGRRRGALDVATLRRIDATLKVSLGLDG